MTFKKYIEKYNINNDIIKTSLDCSNEGLTDLIGIEKFTGLEYLFCFNNHLKDLYGIENLTNLKYLFCHNNQITSLKEIDRLKNLKWITSDITNDIKEAIQLIKIEIRIDKISDIE